jgi:uncharacterized cupredoxin-like copper-binding protein
MNKPFIMQTPRVNRSPPAPKNLYRTNPKHIYGLVLQRQRSPVLFLLLLSILLVARLGSSVGSEVHDVAVTHVTAWPSLTLPSYVHVNVTVENQGTSSETFNVTLHADNLTVTTVNVVDLAPGSNKTFTLKCDLFPLKTEIFPPPPWSLTHPMVVNVTIWAEASAVPGEVDTADNAYADGKISLIWWIVDVNGDGRINILDICILALSMRGFLWPWLDFNQDGVLDIREIITAAVFFGRIYCEPSNLDDP